MKRHWLKLKQMSDKQSKTLKAMKRHMLKKKLTEIRLMRHGLERMVNMMMPLLQLMKQLN
jgi:hypothetical protein